MMSDPVLSSQLGLTPLGVQAREVGQVVVSPLPAHKLSLLSPSQEVSEGYTSLGGDTEMIPPAPFTPLTPYGEARRDEQQGQQQILAAEYSPSSSSPSSSSSAYEAPSQNASNPFETDLKLNIALPQASLLTLVGAVVCSCGVMFGGSNKFVYFGALTLGATALCCTTAGVNQSIMASVRPESRSFAVGLSTLLTHALGDVPSPLILGALADYFSPTTCMDSVVIEGNPCQTVVRDKVGLTTVLLLTNAWLLWPIILWALAWQVSLKRSVTRRGLAVRSVKSALGAKAFQTLMSVLRGMRPRQASAGAEVVRGGDFTLMGDETGPKGKEIELM